MAYDTSKNANETFDIIVVGGGPSGSTAAQKAAEGGARVLLLDRAGRIKPCGGAIPPRLIRDYAIPSHLIVARIDAARIVSPSGRLAHMPVDGSYVGMVDRADFDEYLRSRAAEAGATRATGTYSHSSRDSDGMLRIHYTLKDGSEASHRTRLAIGADGALSKLGKDHIAGSDRTNLVFAYHEIIEQPETTDTYSPARCDVYYNSRYSPDFYAWVFPHGKTASIGTGSAHKGFALREAVAHLRHDMHLDGTKTIRKEGAPIPLKPLKRWDNGRDVLLAGDAAGVVAPASGEGIYYAMLGGELAAETGLAFLKTGDARVLKQARKTFMRAHGVIFRILGMMQYFWYGHDKRLERFVTMCRDKDVQRLTWAAYTEKKMVRSNPLAHVRIFVKDVAHLLGIVAP
ncbi:geranylgeranyl diphosphate reductase [Aestuariivirga sp.]|uniref:geranylgeranyl diphosphate reductase n=1 Tax=Aestuariivirga sp. TaxID=2650926 RepID=UPI0039E61EF6